MHFVVYALDKPGSGDIRAAHRDAHRARLREPGQPLKVVTAGPMLDDAKNAIGSLLIIDAARISPPCGRSSRATSATGRAAGRDRRYPSVQLDDRRAGRVSAARRICVYRSVMSNCAGRPLPR
jgi:uncharacterized protein YciI